MKEQAGKFSTNVPAYNGEIQSVYYGWMNERNDIYPLVKMHSRWIDRINPWRMFIMTRIISDFLNIKYDGFDFSNIVEDPNWKFFGKKRFNIDWDWLGL